MKKSTATGPVLQTRFGMVPEWLFERASTPQAICLYAWLACRYANKERECFPTQKQITVDLKWSLRAVERALTELRHCGGIATKRRTGEKGRSAGVSYFLPLDKPNGDFQPAISGGSSASNPPKSTVQPAKIDDRTKEEPDPLTRSKEQETVASFPEPKPGEVYLKTAHVPKAKTGRHQYHAFCKYPTLCVDKEKHGTFAGRARRAGVEVSDEILVNFYTRVCEELDDPDGDVITDSPAFYLEKEFQKALEADDL